MKDKFPHLDQLRGRGDGFKAADPEFFRDLSRRIEQQDPTLTVAKKRQLWPYMLSAAAAVALLLMLWKNGLAGEQEQPALAEGIPAEMLLDELSDDDILAYIEDNMADFELEMLAEEEEEF